jgi:hypothetical protein
LESYEFVLEFWIWGQGRTGQSLMVRMTDYKYNIRTQDLAS